MRVDQVDVLVKAQMRFDCEKRNAFRITNICKWMRVVEIDATPISLWQQQKNKIKWNSCVFNSISKKENKFFLRMVFTVAHQ